MADLLHHGTSITGFCHIALDDVLGAYGGECQASFTTDEAMGRHFAKAAVTMCSEGQLAQHSDFFAVEHSGWDGTPFAAHRGEVAAGGTGVVLSFDRTSLHAAHAFSAVNFATPGLPTVDLGYSGREREECVFQDVTDLSKHLVRISIDRDAFERYASMVLSILPDDEKARSVVEAGRAWMERCAPRIAECA